ncbi:MAG: TetR/AcrR family transcriptional regulator [Anaerovoracaceae bacterium]
MRTTKDLIIETTIKLIQSAGSDPEQITIRDISKEAGIAVSQINYHFASKENLIAICVQSMIRDVISLFGDTLKQVNDLSSFEKLKHMVNLTFSFLYENENLSRISILTDYQNGALGDNTSLTLKAYFPLIENVCMERNIPNAQLVAESILLTLQGAFLRSNILKDELHTDLRNPQQRTEFVNSVLEQHLR